MHKRKQYKHYLHDKNVSKYAVHPRTLHRWKCAKSENEDYAGILILNYLKIIYYSVHFICTSALYECKKSLFQTLTINILCQLKQIFVGYMHKYLHTLYRSIYTCKYIYSAYM